MLNAYVWSDEEEFLGANAIVVVASSSEEATELFHNQCEMLGKSPEGYFLMGVADNLVLSDEVFEADD